MKIGILTFHFAKNYGAVFQAYALKTALTKLGHEAMVINYCPPQMRGGWDYSFHRSLRKLHFQTIKHKTLKEFLQTIYDSIKFEFFDKKNVRNKFDAFEQFAFEYLCDNHNIITNHQTLQNFLKSYDAVVCGSDQIWNPNITNGFDDVYFTSGLNIRRKLSYAASVGDISLLKDDIKLQEFLDKVRSYHYVSVRESNLMELLRLRGITCGCHCDPTFLLNPSDYDAVSLDRHNSGSPYILVYHLFHDNRMLSYAKKLAKRENMPLKVVNGTLDSYRGSINDMGPVAFLSLLRNASTVITNSFHGIALSLIHHKEFLVFMPLAHKDRITNILSLYSLRDRIIADDNFDKPGIIDYTIVDEVTKKEREKALTYLTSSLS